MITVFTSCFNQAAYLPKAIESVLAQTHSDFEYLLYDDGSTDNTWAVIDAYRRRDSRIRSFRLSERSNVGAVINKSAAASRGTVWTWCPADDIWLPDLLAAKHSTARDCSDTTVLYSDWSIIDGNGAVLQDHHVSRYTPDEFREAVWRECPIGFTGIWIPMSVFAVAGPFPEHLPYSEDFYWMIKATIHGVPFRGVPRILYKKRKHPNSLTARNTKGILARIPRIRAELAEYRKRVAHAQEYVSTQ